MKRRKQFPGATPYKDRHGRRRWRFRKGGFSAELGAHYGSEDFIRRYEAAVEGHRTRGLIGADRTIPKSVGDLVASYYQSQEWLSLTDSTKRAYRSSIEALRIEHADKPVALLERRHIEKMMAKRRETPAAANNFRKRLAQLLDHSIALGWRKDNPARLVKPYRIEGEGFHTWTEDEIAEFFDRYGPGTLPHLVATLMLYTGAARSDAVGLGWHSLRSGRIEYTRQKMRNRSPVKVSIPAHPDLAAVLDRLPKTSFTFLQTR